MDRSRRAYRAEAELLVALGYPARVQILEILRQGEKCVCHIQAVMGQRQAYVSQHLMGLRHAKLVSSRKDGLRIYYQISDPRVFVVLNQLRQIARAQGREIIADKLEPPKGRCDCPQCKGDPN